MEGFWETLWQGLIAGIIVGPLARLVLPGKQNLSVVMTILLGAQWSFSYINVLTGGGPLGATTNIFYLLWDFGFSTMSVGWGSASAVILFLGFGALAFVLFRLIDRYSFHDN